MGAVPKNTWTRLAHSPNRGVFLLIYPLFSVIALEGKSNLFHVPYLQVGTYSIYVHILIQITQVDIICSYSEEVRGCASIALPR